MPSGGNFQNVQKDCKDLKKVCIYVDMSCSDKIRQSLRVRISFSCEDLFLLLVKPKRPDFLSVARNFRNRF